ncbi:MAG: AAA family ATPase [Candidatus Woesearchaeota archaeon]
MTIIITGSVATGKSIIAKKLAKELKHKYLDVNKLIIKEKLREKYSKKLESYPVDIKKLNKSLIKKIKENKKIIIDSHLSHYLPKKYVDLCIVTICDIKELKKRLKKRKYSEKKIKENLETEIFNTILIEAKENKHNILVIDTTKGYNIKQIASYIKKCKT